MTTTLRFTLAAAALAASVSLASAQPAPDNDPHHPADQGGAQAQRPPVPPGQRPMAQGPMAKDSAQPGAMPMKPGGAPGGQGMMMGGDMMKMMSMMEMMRGGTMPMGMGPAGMPPLRHIDGQIAFWKAELKISDAQAPQWTAFADAMRSSATSLRTAMQPAMQASGPATAPEQMERYAAVLSTQLEAAKSMQAVAKPLYGVLSAEQKKTADELMTEHMMGMRARGMAAQ